MVASRQTKLKLRKGFVAAPIVYKVLMNRQFNDKDKTIIAKGLIAATTPDKAQALLPKPGSPSGWSMRNISLVGNFDVRSLHYKGLEVAVFWKRQLSEVIPDPSDPVPEGILEHADDVWARIDLFSKSPRELVKGVQAELSEVARLKTEVESLRRVLAANDVTITTLQGQVKTLQTTRSKKR